MPVAYRLPFLCGDWLSQSGLARTLPPLAVYRLPPADRVFTQLPKHYFEFFQCPQSGLREPGARSKSCFCLSGGGARLRSLFSAAIAYAACMSGPIRLGGIRRGDAGQRSDILHVIATTTHIASMMLMPYSFALWRQVGRVNKIRRIVAHVYAAGGSGQIRAVGRPRPDAPG